LTFDPHERIYVAILGSWYANALLNKTQPEHASFHIIIAKCLCFGIIF
jgi:hypothetical protein